MSKNDEKNLPVPTGKRALKPTDDAGPVVPVRATTGIIDAIATGFGNDLQAFGYRKQANKLHHQAEAVRAARDVTQELRGYAKDLHALRNVDAEIARDDQRFEHEWAKEEREHQMERAQWARQDEAATFEDVIYQTEAEARLAAARAKRANAEQVQANAEWGRDAFEQTMPVRKERVTHKHTTEAIDAEIRRMFVEKAAQQARGHYGSVSEPTENAAETAKLDDMMAWIDQEIQLATANHDSGDALSKLWEIRGKLSAMRQQKTDPG